MIKYFDLIKKKEIELLKFTDLFVLIQSLVGKLGTLRTASLGALNGITFTQIYYVIVKAR